MTYPLPPNKQYEAFVSSNIPDGEDQYTIELNGPEPWESIKFERLEGGTPSEVMHYAVLQIKVAGSILDIFGVSVSPSGVVEVGGGDDTMVVEGKAAEEELVRFVRLADVLMNIE